MKCSLPTNEYQNCLTKGPYYPSPKDRQKRTALAIITDNHKQLHRLRTVPDKVITDKKLMVVNLADQPLHEVEDLSSLNHLCSLDLRNTGLTRVPEWVRETKITRLDLRDNRISELPPWFGPWKIGKAIFLGGNPLPEYEQPDL